MAKSKILICDDEEGILSYLKKLLESQGLAVETFSAGSALLQRLLTGEVSDADLLLQDMKMPDMDGIQVLREVKKLRPALPVIIMTAYGTIDAAVEAIKLGAYDYVTKPFPKEKILGVLENALERELLIKENRALREELNKPAESGAIIFRSDKFREIYDLTLQVAESEANIMILGESGTGKSSLPGRSTPTANGKTAVFSPSTVPPSRTRSWKVSSLVMCAAHSPAPLPLRKGFWRKSTAAPSSWMRSAT